MPGSGKAFVLSPDPVLGSPPSARPKIGLGTFVDYLSSSPSQRLSCVQRHRETYAKPYVPGGDFYGEFVRAVQRGRKLGNDEMNIAAAVARQQSPRRSHYDEIGEAWLEWIAAEGRPEAVSVGRTSWSLDVIEVGISPEIALRRTDGTVQVVKLWMKSPELTKEAANATLRLLTRHMPRLHEGGQPAVLDVRRKRLHVPSKRALRRNYDDWLETEAVGFALLWQKVGRRTA